MRLRVLCRELYDFEYDKYILLDVHCMRFWLGLQRWEMSSSFMPITCPASGCDSYWDIFPSRWSHPCPHLFPLTKWCYYEFSLSSPPRDQLNFCSNYLTRSPYRYEAFGYLWYCSCGTLPNCLSLSFTLTIPQPKFSYLKALFNYFSFVLLSSAKKNNTKQLNSQKKNFR